MAQENDLILILLEEKPLSFARIETISPDVKPGWYQIKLLLLQVPLQVVHWILRDVYIDGEPFTMEGRRMRLEKVEVPEDAAPSESENGKPSKTDPAEGGQVISLQSRKPPKK